jgi:hypothetical protein
MIAVARAGASLCPGVQDMINAMNICNPQSAAANIASANSAFASLGCTFSTTTPQLTLTSLMPTTVVVPSAPYNANLTLTGTNFNNVVSVTFSWTNSVGAVAGSSTWAKGHAGWSNASDTYMTLSPKVVAAGANVAFWKGPHTWTVTLTDNTGATASSNFVVSF